MKYLFLITTLSVVAVSCGDQKRQNFTTLDDEGNIVISEQSIDILEEIERDYYDCKEMESEQKECDHFTAEAICRFYEIDDFKQGADYVSYRDIRDIVTLQGNWEPIGIATSQNDLNAAQEDANNGKATIAFDPNKSNHVAIILPGQMMKSTSWEMHAPNSASFFIHKVDCYVNKALSYSFGSPEGIILYAIKL
ncbi:hypothetical protein JYT72_02630 [Crocinitomix catalasitica]|nr:hypothetical protein [Crocinitomix catalasitica]